MGRQSRATTGRRAHACRCVRLCVCVHSCEHWGGGGGRRGCACACALLCVYACVCVRACVRASACACVCEWRGVITIGCTRPCTDSTGACARAHATRRRSGSQCSRTHADPHTGTHAHERARTRTQIHTHTHTHAHAHAHTHTHTHNAQMGQEQEAQAEAAQREIRRARDELQQARYTGPRCAGPRGHGSAQELRLGVLRSCESLNSSHMTPAGSRPRSLSLFAPLPFPLPRPLASALTRTPCHPSSRPDPARSLARRPSLPPTFTLPASVPLPRSRPPR